MLAALHHDRDRIARMIVRRETAEPGDRVLFPVQHRLGGTRLARHLHVFETRDAPGPAVFIYHLPEAAPNEFDLLRAEVVAKIGVHPRNLRDSDFAFGVEHWAAVLIQ